MIRIVFIATFCALVVNGQLDDDDNGFPCSYRESLQLDRNKHGRVFPKFLNYKNTSTGTPQDSPAPYVMKIFDDDNQPTKFYEPGKKYSGKGFA